MRAWDGALALAVLLLGGAVLTLVVFGSSDLDASTAALVLGLLFVSTLAALRTSAPPQVERLSDPWLAEQRLALDARIDEAREARVELRARAETAGRFREEFVAAVRHELKTPLNVILGFAEVLLQGVDGPLDEQQKEDVEAIAESGEHLQQLVEAVLEEWVPAAQEAPTQLTEVGPLVHEVARMLRGQIGEREVRIEAEVHGDLPTVAADPRRLRQALINLGTNALRATTAGLVRISASQADGAVRLAVRDTGRGISELDLARIFEEFEQVGEGAPGGSGLGLALTRQLVEWQGGTIEVSSTLGEGSCFEIVLPLEDSRT